MQESTVKDQCARAENTYMTAVDRNAGVDKDMTLKIKAAFCIVVLLQMNDYLSPFCVIYCS